MSFVGAYDIENCESAMTAASFIRHVTAN